jgi:S1-C subfamily serine protease
MALSDNWKVPPSAQPSPGDHQYDLDRALSSVVALRARVPEDAFTAETLGTEREGHAVVIGEEGLLATVGYLVTEAEEVWLTTGDGRVVQGHVLSFDYATGFGLVQALGRLGVPALPIGDPGKLEIGDRVVVGGAGGRARSVSARLVARQEFAGYWEYLLDEALFTAPAHPNWGGTALIGPGGELMGIGSLQLQHGAPGGRVLPINMIVPIDLLTPILDDMVRLGRPSRPARPWLGLFAAEDEEDRILVTGLAGDGPAKRAGLRPGDAVLAVAGEAVSDLAGFFRGIWALGEAGVEVPLTLEREGDRFDVIVTSGDRQRFLKTARLH